MKSGHRGDGHAGDRAETVVVVEPVGGIAPRRTDHAVRDREGVVQDPHGAERLHPGVIERPVDQPYAVAGGGIARVRHPELVIGGAQGGDVFPAQRQRDERIGFREPALAEVSERDVDEPGFGVQGGTGEFGEPDGEEVDVQVLVLHDPDVAQEQDVLRDDRVEEQVRAPGEARPPLVEGILRYRFLGFHERGGGLAAHVDLGEGVPPVRRSRGDGGEERARDDRRGERLVRSVALIMGSSPLSLCRPRRSRFSSSLFSCRTRT